MSGALGAGGIAAGDAFGECRAEACEIAFQRADEPGTHVIASGGLLNAPDLIDELPIEQLGGTLVAHLGPLFRWTPPPHTTRGQLADDAPKRVLRHRIHGAQGRSRTGMTG